MQAWSLVDALFFFIKNTVKMHVMWTMNASIRAESRNPYMTVYEKSRYIVYIYIYNIGDEYYSFLYMSLINLWP